MTERQSTVLRLRRQGIHWKQIATVLVISSETCRRHYKSALYRENITAGGLSARAVNVIKNLMRQHKYEVPSSVSEIPKELVRNLLPHVPGSQGGITNCGSKTLREIEAWLKDTPPIHAMQHD